MARACNGVGKLRVASFACGYPSYGFRGPKPPALRICKDADSQNCPGCFCAAFLPRNLCKPFCSRALLYGFLGGGAGKGNGAGYWL